MQRKGVGVVCLMFAIILLVITADEGGCAVVRLAVFCAANFSVFICLTALFVHRLPSGRAKRIFLCLTH